VAVADEGFDLESGHRSPHSFALVPKLHFGTHLFQKLCFTTTHSPERESNLMTVKCNFGMRENGFDHGLHGFHGLMGNKGRQSKSSAPRAILDP
jgi:hypothetical protein